jgi:hypothetical protein
MSQLKRQIWQQSIANNFHQAHPSLPVRVESNLLQALLFTHRTPKLNCLSFYKDTTEKVVRTSESGWSFKIESSSRKFNIIFLD